MVVEVDVCVQLLAVQILVRSAAGVFGIVEQSLDVRDAPHQIQKLPIAHQPVEPRVSRSQSWQAGHHSLASRFAPLVQRLPSLKRRETCKQFPAQPKVDECFDPPLPERLRFSKSTPYAIH